MLAAAHLEPGRDASPLGRWYHAAVAEAGDEWRGLRAAVAKLLIVSGEPPRRWRYVARDFTPAVARALELGGGHTPERARGRAQMLALASELEALACWEDAR